jgi:drug/metabolite transporter (DMT)-like permease
MKGNVAAVMSSVGFAGYAVCVRSDVRRDWSPVMPGYALMMIVLCTAITVAGGGALVPPGEDVALAALHGGVFIVVGTTLFNVASRQIPAVPMAVFAQTEMLFVPIWALAVLGEEPSGQALVGGAIIFAAVVGKALIDARTRPAT